MGKKAEAEKANSKKDITASYNQYKFFQGKQYTGMTVGRSHKWYYDKGVWHDKKITPEKWLIDFATTKRRAGKAPEGSGVPVGTEYHWYIMAHQVVKKLDANSYSTSLNGLKFKLAHKRVTKGTWSSSEHAQKKHLIKILANFIKELEQETDEQFETQFLPPSKTKQIPKAKPARKIKPAVKKKTVRRQKELELA